MNALIFDLDDTLVVEVASAEAAFLQTCELARRRYGVDPAALHASLRPIARRLWHGSPARAYAVKIGISSWEALWARFDGDHESVRTLRAWAPTYRRDSWLGALREHGVEDVRMALELAETFPVERRKLHVVYDDVRPTLEALRGAYRLGLLTNGACDLQREKIDGAGIGHYFDEIVISGDVGVGKPHRRVFETILSRLQVTPAEAVMIGNSLRTDVAGARDVGITTVWVNRDNSPCDDEPPDVEISGLDGLRDILAERGLR
jgi:putative hydrolase of the HAD superfamily